MSDGQEGFVLARRGLPLPSAGATMPRWHWLPPARPHVEARRSPGPPAEPAPAVEEEPWWMEAVERVPNEDIAFREHAPAAISPATSERRERVTATPAPQLRAAAGHPGTPEIVRAAPQGLPISARHEASSRPAPREAERAPLPGQPAAAPLPGPAEAAAFAITDLVESARPVGTQPHTRNDAPPRSMDSADVNISVARMERLVTVVPRERADSPTSTGVPPAAQEPAGPPQPAETSWLAVPEYAGAPRVAPSQDMGLPPAMARVETVAVPVDITPLLTPARGGSREIHIDRIAVSVQPARAAGAAAAVPPAASRTPSPAAPPARPYRNPWSSYFNRRD